MSTLDEITKRFEELISEGLVWVRSPLDGRDSYYVDHGARGWLTAAVSLTETVTQGRGTYFTEIKSLTTHPDLRVGVPKQCVEMGVGILKALHIDWRKGLIRQIEFLVSAENFDTFFDHAEGFHRGGHVRESGALVSIVFEDAMRKLAKKSDLGPTDGDLEVLIDEAVKKAIITPVAGKRYKGAAGLRNKALHAKWDEFDLKDVGEAIRTTRQLIETL